MSIILDALKKMRKQKDDRHMWIFSAKRNAREETVGTHPSSEPLKGRDGVFKDQKARQRRVWILVALNILLISVLAMILNPLFKQREEKPQAVFITPEMDRSPSSSPLDEQSWATAVVWPQAYPLESAQVIQGQIADLFSSTAPEKGPAKFRLSGTYKDTEGEKIAIINDRLLRIGDRVKGARVVRIDEGTVELDAQGKPVQLKI